MSGKRGQKRAREVQEEGYESVHGEESNNSTENLGDAVTEQNSKHARTEQDGSVADSANRTQGQLLAHLGQKLASSLAKRPPITSLFSGKKNASGGRSTVPFSPAQFTDRTKFVRDPETGEFPFVVVASAGGAYTDVDLNVIERNGAAHKKLKGEIEGISASAARELGVMPAVQLTCVVFKGGIMHRFGVLTNERAPKGWGASVFFMVVGTQPLDEERDTVPKLVITDPQSRKGIRVPPVRDQVNQTILNCKEICKDLVAQGFDIRNMQMEKKNKLVAEAMLKVAKDNGYKVVREADLSIGRMPEVVKPDGKKLKHTNDEVRKLALDAFIAGAKMPFVSEDEDEKVRKSVHWSDERATAMELTKKVFSIEVQDDKNRYAPSATLCEAVPLSDRVTDDDFKKPVCHERCMNYVSLVKAKYEPPRYTNPDGSEYEIPPLDAKGEPWEDAEYDPAKRSVLGGGSIISVRVWFRLYSTKASGDREAMYGVKAYFTPTIQIMERRYTSQGSVMSDTRFEGGEEVDIDAMSDTEIGDYQMVFVDHGAQ